MSFRRKQRPISSRCRRWPIRRADDADQTTLRHKEYEAIWSLDDTMNAPNAQTAVAAREQAPVIAENSVADMRSHEAVAQHDGYGSCPLTVERGEIVLAEFG